ncbi:hypothetical protein SRABI128_05821 [Microbacterium sp. Bi128]|nr:hypothetical protein SRABI128_05821 [Microbacterium sp. Bi128]
MTDRQRRPQAIDVRAPGARPPDHAPHVRCPRIVRDAEDPALRQRRRPDSGDPRDPRSGGVRGDHLIGEPEFGQQAADDPAAGGEALRPDVEREAAHLGRAHDSPEHVGGFQHRDLHADLGALQRRDETGDPPARDDDAALVRVLGEPLERVAHIVSPCAWATMRLRTVGSVSGGTP